MRIIPLIVVLFCLQISICSSRTLQPPQPNKHDTVIAIGKTGLLHLVTFEGKRYLVCQADPRRYKIEAFNKHENSAGVYSFEEIAKLKKPNLIFAMNGGMFEADLSPVGLFIAGGKTYRDINLNEGTGNFYQLKPNGIFLIDEHDDAHVITSETYSAARYRAKLATQSGPMLLIKGVINSNFKEHSSNLNIRNAVGVNDKGDVVFAISLDPVNFYEFAQLSKTKLNCDNALYLDGFVSQYFAPELQKSPALGLPLGIFITVSTRAH